MGTLDRIYADCEADLNKPLSASFKQTEGERWINTRIGRMIYMSGNEDIVFLNKCDNEDEMLNQVISKAEKMNENILGDCVVRVSCEFHKCGGVSIHKESVINIAPVYERHKSLMEEYRKNIEEAESIIKDYTSRGKNYIADMWKADKERKEFLLNKTNKFLNNKYYGKQTSKRIVR